MNGSLDFSVILHGQYGQMIVDGVMLTLQLAVSSWVLAMVLAMILVVIRLTTLRPLQWLVMAYVSWHRNVPTLIQLMIWYFAVPTLLPESVQIALNDYNAEFLFAVVALGLCQAAYFSEDIRSGLRSTPDGQREAARALGMGYVKTMRLIILPQGIRNALPALINHTVLLFKNTSLAMVIGVMDLTYVTQQLENETFRTFEAYLVSTVCYLSCSLLLMGAGALLARRFQRVYAR